MLKRGIGVAAIAATGALVVGAPAGASENGGHEGGGHGQAVRVAAAACKKERQDLGREAFAQTYGSHPMRACLQQTVGEARNAAQECRAERDDIGVDQFRGQYGTNHNGRNAFGMCVSEHVNGDDTGGDVCPPGDGTGTPGDGAGTPGDGTGTPGDGGTAGAAQQRPTADHGAAQGDDCSADAGSGDDGSADDGGGDAGSADNGSADDGGGDDGADGGGTAA